VNDEPIVITSMARTPMGGFQGELKSLSGTDLGTAALKAALQRSSLGGSDVSEVMMGNVLPAGLGQAPARQAALGAGLDLSTPCTTISKVCGSGMKATMLGHDMISVGSADIIAAAGMESMTNAPYLVPKMRNGARLGHAEMLDHMFFDGLEDAYDKGRLMGTFAESCADHYSFTREQQDEYALASLDRALKAIEKGHFRNEITPVDTGRGMVDVDEQPGKARPDKIPSLKPAFRKDGTVTAANSSSISDGGAALVLMRRSEAEKRGFDPTGYHCRPLQPCQGARVVYHRAGRSHSATHGQDRMERIGCGSVRDQRGVFGRASRRDEGAGYSPRQGECTRWRLRIGASPGRFRGTDYCDLAGGDADL